MRLFSVFSRVASGSPLRGPLKLTCHSPAPPEGGGREGDADAGKITKSVLAASRSASARQSALQYSFDGRSFNINCGFSADGNVFFIAGVTPWWSGWPAVCDALSCVADELLFCTLCLNEIVSIQVLVSFDLFLLRSSMKLLFCNNCNKPIYSLMILIFRRRVGRVFLIENLSQTCSAYSISNEFIRRAKLKTILQ